MILSEWLAGRHKDVYATAAGDTTKAYCCLSMIATRTEITKDLKDGLLFGASLAPDWSMALDHLTLEVVQSGCFLCFSSQAQESLPPRYRSTNWLWDDVVDPGLFG